MHSLSNIKVLFSTQNFLFANKNAQTDELTSNNSIWKTITYNHQIMIGHIFFKTVNINIGVFPPFKFYTKLLENTMVVL